eukprot:gene12423-16735_t
MFSVRKGFTGLEPARTDETAAAEVENAHGRGRIVVLCDHASNRLPQRYGTLGLDAEQLNAHFAWDP